MGFSGAISGAKMATTAQISTTAIPITASGCRHGERAALRSARRAGRTLDVLLSRSPGLSLADAYRVQDQVTALRLADGERRAGWKLGYTSAVMRALIGVRVSLTEAATTSEALLTSAR